MCRSLFVKIVDACKANCRYFTHPRNAAGLLGFSPYQNISAAMRVIAYGIPTDYADEYLRIGEDTTIESVRRSRKVTIPLFGPLCSKVSWVCLEALTVCTELGRIA
jgi:hypothetical protein